MTRLDPSPFLRGVAWLDDGRAVRADPADLARLPWDTAEHAALPIGVRLEFTAEGAEAVEIRYRASVPGPTDGLREIAHCFALWHGGNCVATPEPARGELSTAQQLAALPADAITLVFGTNCRAGIPCSAPLLYETTRAFIALVRQGHPHTRCCWSPPCCAPTPSRPPTASASRSPSCVRRWRRPSSTSCAHAQTPRRQGPCGTGGRGRRGAAYDTLVIPVGRHVKCTG
ncbi:hypothetical protein [Streptomyces sp. NPDC000880]